MPHNKSDESYLWDMLEAARRVSRYVAGKSLARYQADDQLRDAVQYRVQVVGEAAWKLSAEFKAAHPEVPWNKIASQRHIIVHDYDRIDDRIIWDVATLHIVTLVDWLEKNTPEPPPAE